MKNKIKIRESQLDSAIYNLLSEDNILSESEDLNKSDVENIAKKEIKNFFDSSRNTELENKVKLIIRDFVKNDKDFEKSVLEISRNVLVQLYKALWSKRSFWTSDLKNSSS